MLEKIREEKAQRYRYFAELSSSDSSISPNSTPPPTVSGDYTEVALIFTEVLQLQVPIIFLLLFKNNNYDTLFIYLFKESSKRCCISSVKSY